MPKPVRLGLLYFYTRKEAMEFLRTILWRHPPGTVLKGIEHYALTQAYRLHPNRDTSIGILRHEIGLNYGDSYRQGSPGFHTYLADGRMETWSYRAPIEPWSAEAWINEAARNTWLAPAREWKMSQRDAGGRLICRRCSAVTPWEEAEIHHLPPHEFKHIVEAWLGDREDVGIVKRDGVVVLEEASSFLDFHRQRASLLLVCRECHQREKRWRRDETPHRTVKRSIAA